MVLGSGIDGAPSLGIGICSENSFLTTSHKLQEIPTKID